MKRFVVRWKIEVEAFDAEHAAVKARRVMLTTDPAADRLEVTALESGLAVFAVDLSANPPVMIGEAVKLESGRFGCPVCEQPMIAPKDSQSHRGRCPRCNATLMF